MLPGTDGRSAWARLMRDVVGALEHHCGGDLTEVERMTARRAAALEVELCHMESQFAEARAAGRSPTPRRLICIHDSQVVNVGTLRRSDRNAGRATWCPIRLSTPEARPPDEHSSGHR